MTGLYRMCVLGIYVCVCVKRVVHVGTHLGRQTTEYRSPFVLHIIPHPPPHPTTPIPPFPQRWREPIMAATRLFLMGAALAHRLTHPDLYLARGWLPQSLPATCAASMACLSSLLWPVRWFVHLQLQTMVVVLATVHIVAAYAEPSSAVYKAPWWVTTGAILVLGHVLPTGWLWVEERRLRSSFSPTAGGT